MPPQRLPRAARVFPAPLPLALACAALAGCGSSGHGVASKPPREIIAAALSAAESASSVHVTGSIDARAAHESFDIVIVAGKGAHGTVSTRDSNFELIETGGTVYLRGNAAFYRRIGGAEAARLLHGKWLKAPATGAKLAPLLRLADLHSLVSSSLAGHARLASAGASVVRGVAVVGVRDASAAETVYVATSGRPYPVEIAKTGSGGGTITFDAWDAPVALIPPARAIDISALQAHA
jgi:hypothetical protein